MPPIVRPKGIHFCAEFLEAPRDSKLANRAEVRLEEAAVRSVDERRQGQCPAMETPPKNAGLELIRRTTGLIAERLLKASWPHGLKGSMVL